MSTSSPKIFIGNHSQAAFSLPDRRDGDLGLWSSFALRVGSPQQTVRVIPSTAGTETWVISPLGCPPGEPGISPASSCPESRGGLFNASQSSSWQALSNNSLQLDSNLGYGDYVALYGDDTITLGFSDSIGGLHLDSQLVAALAPEHYYIGLFGLNPQASNLTNFSDPHPSPLTSMKEKNLIPSRTWAYTAGAPYREWFHSVVAFLAFTIKSAATSSATIH